MNNFAVLSKILIFTLSVFLSVKVTAAKSFHQVGDEWGKERIDASPAGLSNNLFIQGKPFAKKVAEATAWLTQPAHDNKTLNLNYLGSGHLLGLFDGRFVMMTNSHLVHEKFCSGITIEFVFLPNKPKVVCEKVFYRNERLDYALMFVNPAESDRALFSNLGVNLAYDTFPQFGESLYTIGFNRHNGIRDLKPGESPHSPAVAYLTRDEDCRVLSTKARLIRNPKRPTEIFKPTHSFSVATGCDAFDAGDCGAVYVQTDADKIVGLYWSEGFDPGEVIDSGNTYAIDDSSGKILNPAGATFDVVPASFVKAALKGRLGRKQLWSKFTYMVPASKIRELVLKEPLAHEADYACVFEGIFGTKIKECRASTTAIK